MRAERILEQKRNWKLELHLHSTTEKEYIASTDGLSWQQQNQRVSVTIYLLYLYNTNKRLWPIVTIRNYRIHGFFIILQLKIKVKVLQKSQFYYARLGQILGPLEILLNRLDRLAFLCRPSTGCVFWRRLIAFFILFSETPTDTEMKSPTQNDQRIFIYA